MSQIVRVWDLPTRLFHWSLASCVIGLVLTGQIGEDLMAWHFRLGYATLALLLFRLLWGVVGGHWSRFAQFPPAPRQLLAYLRSPRHAPSVGHSPLGALSVYAMLAILLFQVGTGLISDDEIANAGPLTRFVSESVIGAATRYHSHIGKLIIIGLVVVHLLAITYHRLRHRDRLVQAMLRGDKSLDAPTRSSRDDLLARFFALSILAVCAGLVYLLLRWAA